MQWLLFLAHMLKMLHQFSQSIHHIHLVCKCSWADQADFLECSLCCANATLSQEGS